MSKILEIIEKRCKEYLTLTDESVHYPLGKTQEQIAIERHLDNLKALDILVDAIEKNTKQVKIQNEINGIK